MTAGSVVIGLGSPHGDDQIGWRLIERLKEEASLTGSFWSVNDAIDIVEHLRGVRRLVLVDACRSGHQPGTITRLNWLDHRISRQRGETTHRTSLSDALQLARLLERLPEQVIVYGVEVKQWAPQTDICPEVLLALPELVRRVAAELLIDELESRVDSSFDGEPEASARPKNAPKNDNRCMNGH